MQGNFVDREYRNQLITIINRYLDGQYSSLDYADLISLSEETEDKTVEMVADHLEDILGTERVPDAAPITKKTWDYLQRLLLLLHSDAHVQYVPGTWSITQLGALITLLVYASIAIINGRGYDPLLAIPFSFFAWLFARLRAPYLVPARTPFQEIIYPFPSVTALSSVYQSTSTFRKRRFPSDRLAASASPTSSVSACPKSMLQKVSSCLQYAATFSKTYLGYMCLFGLLALLSPLVLLSQIFPIQRDEVVVSLTE